MKTLALCTNLEAFDLGGFDQPDLTDKYPGCGWMRYFAKRAEREGYQVLPGLLALANARHGTIDPKDVLVIQEEMNRNGEALVALGAKPAVLFCQESPIYTPLFYDALPSLKKVYPAQMLFDGGTHHMHFPSYDFDAPLPDLIPWDERRNLVMVMSAKHFSMLGGRWAHSPSWKAAIQTQLQDERFRAIETMQADLYGKGFPNQIMDGHKINVIKHYKKAICYENGAYPGYITEKIIDCMVAGVIPIYKGAPDIEKYIPAAEYSEVNAMHPWLKSHLGYRYSYQGFAYDMLNICGNM